MILSYSMMLNTITPCRSFRALPECGSGIQTMGTCSTAVCSTVHTQPSFYKQCL